MGNLQEITENDVIEELVRRAFLAWDSWAPGTRSEGFERLMRPVLLDIAVEVYRDEIDAALARRMGLDQRTLDIIVTAMRKE